MISGLLVIIVSGVLSILFIDYLARKEKNVSAPFLKFLFFYHLVFTLLYYFYALNNPSDSVAYYSDVQRDYKGEDWSDFYGTSTSFISFFGYPFIKWLGFSYEAMMALFSFLGFLGFIFFYRLFVEDLDDQYHKWARLFLLMPGLHFWSSSFGKGAIIFLGVALFFWGLSRLSERWLPVILGALIIYYVRPHLMLFFLVSCLIGFLLSSHKISWKLRVFFIFLAVTGTSVAYYSALDLVGTESEEFMEEGLDLSHRVDSLARATSGVPISEYNLGLKLFTFLYRPLFFDAPGFLGFVVSLENVFYLAVTLFLVGWGGMRYVVRGDFVVKAAFLSFLVSALALAEISGNLGLAVRQKSQVIPLLLFGILRVLNARKLKAPL